MRMMMKIQIPVEAGNRGVVEGTLPQTVGAFVDKYKPEGAYFVAEDGMRTGYFFFDLKDVVEIPSAGESFLLNLNAAITMAPAMNVADMKKGVAQAAKLR